MPPMGFEPANKRPQTHTLDGGATEIGEISIATCDTITTSTTTHTTTTITNTTTTTTIGTIPPLL